MVQRLGEYSRALTRLVPGPLLDDHLASAAARIRTLLYSGGGDMPPYGPERQGGDRRGERLGLLDLGAPSRVEMEKTRLTRERRGWTPSPPCTR